MSWVRRAQSGTLPTAATGGTARLFRCPDCPFEDSDPEVTFAHLWTHNDRRVTPQHARRRDGERRVA